MPPNAGTMRLYVGLASRDPRLSGVLLPSSELELRRVKSAPQAVRQALTAPLYRTPHSTERPERQLPAGIHTRWSAVPRHGALDSALQPVAGQGMLPASASQPAARASERSKFPCQ